MTDYLIFSEQRILIDEIIKKINKNKKIAVGNIRSMDWVNDINQSTIILLDARLKWTDCKEILRFLYRSGCYIVFLTDEKDTEKHLKAIYRGHSTVLHLPIKREAFRDAIKAAKGNKKRESSLKLMQNERIAVLNGKKIELTAQELALLNALMIDGNPPVSREQLLRTAWGYQSIGETRTVDVHVQRLRKKMGDELIETVYRCGYRLNLA